MMMMMMRMMLMKMSMMIMMTGGLNMQPFGLHLHFPNIWNQLPPIGILFQTWKTVPLPLLQELPALGFGAIPLYWRHEFSEMKTWTRNHSPLQMSQINNGVLFIRSE